MNTRCDIISPKATALRFDVWCSWYIRARTLSAPRRDFSGKQRFSPSTVMLFSCASPRQLGVDACEQGLRHGALSVEDTGTVVALAGVDVGVAVWRYVACTME